MSRIQEQIALIADEMIHSELRRKRYSLNNIFFRKSL